MEACMSLKFFRGACVTALSLASLAAQASFVLTSQGVVFTFNQLDSDSFTLRIVGAPDATGNWANDTHLGFFAFKDLGPLTGITGATVTNIQPTSTSVWSYSANELNANGCAGGASGGICLAANPNIALTSDMLFQVDLAGTTLAIDQIVGPHLKLGFTHWVDAKGDPTKNNYVPGHYDIGGDLLSQNMPFVNDSCVGPSCGGGGGGAGGGGTTDTPLPEPASIALVALALTGAAVARRKRA